MTHIRKGHARLDRHRCAVEANPYIDGSAGLERAAIGRATTSNVTKRRAQIDAELVPRATATAATSRAALRQHHVPERHQRDSRQKTTRDLPHIKPPARVENPHTA